MGGGGARDGQKEREGMGGAGVSKLSRLACGRSLEVSGKRRKEARGMPKLPGLACGKSLEMGTLKFQQRRHSEFEAKEMCAFVLHKARRLQSHIKNSKRMPFVLNQRMIHLFRYLYQTTVHTPKCTVDDTSHAKRYAKMQKIKTKWVS